MDRQHGPSGTQALHFHQCCRPSEYPRALDAVHSHRGLLFRFCTSMGIWTSCWKRSGRVIGSASSHQYCCRLSSCSSPAVLLIVMSTILFCLNGLILQLRMSPSAQGFCKKFDGHSKGTLIWLCWTVELHVVNCCVCVVVLLEHCQYLCMCPHAWPQRTLKH